MGGKNEGHHWRKRARKCYRFVGSALMDVGLAQSVDGSTERKNPKRNLAQCRGLFSRGSKFSPLPKAVRSIVCTAPTAVLWDLQRLGRLLCDSRSKPFRWVVVDVGLWHILWIHSFWGRRQRHYSLEWSGIGRSLYFGHYDKCWFVALQNWRCGSVYMSLALPDSNCWPHQTLHQRIWGRVGGRKCRSCPCTSCR